MELLKKWKGINFKQEKMWKLEKSLKEEEFELNF